MKSIAVVGAGISGLVVASGLKALANVTVFEKSGEFGGRLATRWRAPCVYDHGPLALHVQSDAFRSFCDAHQSVWQPAGAAITQAIGPATIGPGAIGPGAIVPFDKTKSLVAPLLDGLDLHVNVRITELIADSDGVTLFDFNGQSLGQFDQVVLAIPARQVLELVTDRIDGMAAVAEAAYDACMVGLYRFDHRLDLPKAYKGRSPIKYIHNSSAKPGRDLGAECWVVHMDQAWSWEYRNTEKPDLAQAILKLWQDQTSTLPDPIQAYGHRWLYSQVRKPCGQDYVADKTQRIFACGDWCLGPNADHAYRSGLALANALSAQL